ncbi:MAG: hypothetical protein ABIE47_05470 [Pseudomonadota bacterium]|uniref:Uncharacterized protein n=1 Tax=viral metagenome TaxID=1070528 RepID=A0A6M3LF21_9ZZZZ
MRRLVKIIAACDLCPYHFVGGTAYWCTVQGLRDKLEITDYPIIPDWCPLEEVLE